jgi:hypothetical protein
MAAMAIKGKKKSKGSAGARRPAGAPRPQIPTTRRKQSFWRTRDGILILAIFVLVAIGVVVWLIGDARKDAAAEEDRRTALSQYSDSVKPVLGEIDDEVSDMTALTALPTEDEIADLAKTAQEWGQAFQNAQLLLSQQAPAENVQAISQLFGESVALYGNAAGFLASLDGLDLSAEQQTALFQNFAGQRDLATAMLTSTIATLDQIRIELGMERSGLQAPGGAAPPPAEVSPTPESETTIEAPGGGGSGNGSKKKDKKDGGEDSNG